MSERLRATIATTDGAATDHDHFRDFRTGLAQAAHRHVAPEDIFPKGVVTRIVV